MNVGEMQERERLVVSGMAWHDPGESRRAEQADLATTSIAVGCLATLSKHHITSQNTFKMEEDSPWGGGLGALQADTTRD